MPGTSRRDGVSDATAQRLSLLLRRVRVLESEGVDTASSTRLADRLGLNPAQIRKDLAQFGEFGVRGVGYRIAELRDRLKALMGLDRTRGIVIVGAGNLGQALADSRNFNGEHFHVAALFDGDGRKVGRRTRTGVEIRDVAGMPAFLASPGVDIGVLAVPADAVHATAAALVAGGVKAILNFAPVPAPTSPGVLVRNVDLGFFLEGLGFQLKSTPGPEKGATPRRAPR